MMKNRTETPFCFFPEQILSGINAVVLVLTTMSID